MGRFLAACWCVVLVSGLLVEGAPASSPAENGQGAASASSFAVGQNVEVKWGGLWRQAQIVRKQGDWTLVAYDKGAFREWVEPYRIRKAGSKEDAIGYAAPNEMMTKSQTVKPPPREKPEPAPEPKGTAGGEKVDRSEAFKNDPAFKEADLAGAQQLELIATGEGWTLGPDGLPPTAQPVSRPVTLKGATDKFWDSPKAIAMARGANLALVAHVNTEPGHLADTRVERVNLGEGSSQGVFSVTPGTTLLDVAPDGSSMLLRSDEFQIGKKGRLELWTLAGTPKRTLVFFPYGQSQWHERDVEAALFVDATHAVTVSRKGTLVLWDLPACKAVYTCEVLPASRPALSAGGKYLAIETGKFVFILEPLTGKVLAEIAYETGGGAGNARGSSALAFSPSGKTLAALMDEGFIDLFDMSSGKATRQFVVPVSGTSSMQMISDDYLVLDTRLDGAILVDCAKRVALWKYEMGRGNGAGGGASTVSPGGRLVYAVRDADRKLTVLNAIALPDADASAEAAKLKEDEILLLHPGVKVSLEINLDANAGLRKQIGDSLRKRLEANGLVVSDEAQPIRVVVSTEPGKTVQREYRSFGAPFGQTQKVDVPGTITRIAIEQDGKVAWEKRSVSEAGFMLMLKQGQSIQDAVNEASKPNYTMIREARLPAYLAKPREPAPWFGNSRLTARGAVQEPLHSADQPTRPDAAPGHSRPAKDRNPQVRNGGDQGQNFF